VVTVPNHKRSAQSRAPAADRPAPDWPERITALAATFHAWLTRPRVRLSVIGVSLLLVGGLIMANSVWTLPLVVAGALMVAVAWIGRRLEGRFAVEWGEGGTQLAFNATIKATPPATDVPALDRAADPGSPPPAEPATGIPDVIEGEAHTVEINVGELKALIAAAEAADVPPDPIVRDIRVRRLTDNGDRTPRPAS
jgi:hypothetical protein